MAYWIKPWGTIPAPTPDEMEKQRDFDRYVEVMKKQVQAGMYQPTTPQRRSVAVDKEEWVKSQFILRFLQENQPDLFKTLVDGAAAHWAMTSDK